MAVLTKRNCLTGIVLNKANISDISMFSGANFNVSHTNKDLSSLVQIFHKNLYIRLRYFKVSSDLENFNPRSPVDTTGQKHS